MVATGLLGIVTLAGTVLAFLGHTQRLLNSQMAETDG
jgi:hypothetical protein